MSSAQAKAKFIRSALDAASVASFTPSASARDPAPAPRALPPTARLLLGVLVAASWPEPGGDGWVVNADPDRPDLTARQIAAKLGVGPATVRRCLDQLAAAGLVELGPRGSGRAATFYRLVPPEPARPEPAPAETRTDPAAPPHREGAPAPPQRARQRHLRGSASATSEGALARVALKEFQDSQDSRTTRPPAAAPAGGGVRSGGLITGAELDGAEAVKFERLSRKPAWYRGRRWIDTPRALALARSPATLLEVDAALAQAREAYAEDPRLRVPGFVISRVERPDAFAVEAERARRVRAAERDRREAEARARREAERREAEDQDRRIRAAELDALERTGPAEADRLIETWLRTDATRHERDMLGGRSPEERREALMRRGRLAAVLELAAETGSGVTA